MLSNNEISSVLENLYDELVNEIDNHCNLGTDEHVIALAEAIKAAVKSTNEKYYKSQE